MRGLILLLLLYGANTYASFFIEPRIQLNGANQLSSFSGTERSIYAGTYVDWENDYFYMRFNGEYRYDGIFNSHYSSASRDKYRSVFWLDEFYLERKFDIFNLYLGYQKVIWGQADELRVVDVINPLDYRQFVLMDLNDYMYPLPMLRVVSDVVPDWTFEAMWVMKFKANQYPPPGSEFNMGVPTDLPHKKNNKGEFAFSVTTNVEGFDLGWYAFRGYSDDPLYRADDHALYMHYPQESMLGTSVSTALQNWVIRAESAWFPGKYYNNIYGDHERHDTVKYLLGLDYLYKDWMVTAQITDHHIVGWHSKLDTLSSDPYYTLSLEGKTFSDNLSLRLSNTWSGSSGGGNLLQSKIKYQYNTNLSFNIYLDIMGGTSRNLIGSQSDSSRIMYSVIYKFSG
ncbi:DUF1302 family protein [Enterobacter ludwigii]|uniref:DUF1302 family protein n=1 Tax=Enterobacter ludwigii TaxID=299767 RepID=UPI00397540B1